MRTSRPCEAVATGLLAITLLTACNTASEQATAPEHTGPDSALQQVEHAMGYSKQLGKLPVRQQFSFAAENEQVKVYNFGTTNVDPGQFAGVVNFFEATENNPPSRSITTYLGGGDAPKQTKTQEGLRKADTRYILLVPAGQAMPTTLTQGNASHGAPLTAATEYFPDKSQTASVVQQPTDTNGKSTDFMKNGDLVTEVCQSVVEVKNKTQEGDMAERLAQETVCNGYGDAVEGILKGYTYNKYKSWEQGRGLAHIFTSYGPYSIEPLVLSRPAYDKLAEVVEPSN